MAAIVIYTSVDPVGGGMGSPSWDENQIESFETEDEAKQWVEEHKDSRYVTDIRGPYHQK